MLSPLTKSNISRIAPFGMIWLVFSFVYTQLEKGILGNLKYYPSSGNAYNFNTNIFVTPISALLTGLLIGVLEIFYFSQLFSRKSFSQKIIIKSLIYLVIIVSFVLVLTVITNASELQQGVFSKQVWDAVGAFFSKYSFISVVIFIAAIIVVTQFYNEVSENIGQPVLHNFFTGKYHRPIEEERIYMFLDMKSSTTIAENLGHVKYFEMLRDYYADLSEPITMYSGEIYQYVGDEVVVSWKLKNGLQDGNCLRCFFSMKEALAKQAKTYEEKYGVVPGFKAGLHVGKVTTGEIGVIKKDIIFTGDVLNTTARIQGLCNLYEVDILVSNQLKTMLTGAGPFNFQLLGENELRGRNEKIILYTIRGFNVSST